MNGSFVLGSSPATTGSQKYGPNLAPTHGDDDGERGLWVSAVCRRRAPHRASKGVPPLVERGRDHVRKRDGLDVPVLLELVHVHPVLELLRQRLHVRREARETQVDAVRHGKDFLKVHGNRLAADACRQRAACGQRRAPARERGSATHLKRPRKAGRGGPRTEAQVAANADAVLANHGDHGGAIVLGDRLRPRTPPPHARRSSTHRQHTAYVSTPKLALPSRSFPCPLATPRTSPDAPPCPPPVCMPHAVLRPP